MKQFTKYSMILDDEVRKLPTLKMWKASDDPRRQYLSNFVLEMKNVLGLLQAQNVHEYDWHDEVSPLEFRPTPSPYFRMGTFGLMQKMPVNDKLTGMIAIGYDEELDYYDTEKPEIIISISNDKFCSDVEVFEAQTWRTALDEFFDMNLAIRRLP